MCYEAQALLELGHEEVGFGQVGGERILDRDETGSWLPFFTTSDDV